LKVRAGSFGIDHNLAHYAAINRGALFLACKATAVEFDASFYAVQALELAAGAVNITLLGFNLRDGLRMKG
jgi:formylmethanofuran:tetrahydromethanopterin formyltransferase